MATIIPGAADPHWSDKKPVSRKDDYHATQVRKLTDLIKLSDHLMWEGVETKAAAIVFAGDLFHQPRGKLITRKLDHKLIQVMRTSPCPIAAISGNHDTDRIRQASLEEHPLGILDAAGIIHLVHWPRYILVGTDPPVIITGRQYTVEGPADWLEHIAATGELRALKQKLSDELGKPVQMLLMTHCHWGTSDSTFHGDPIVGYRRMRNTGANVMIYGHPHTDDGVVEIEDEDNSKISIVGPGALIRGTLAEHDVNRQPKIAVMVFNPDKTHQVLLVPIPHEPPEKIFDSAGHERKKRQKKVEEEFIQELKRISTKAKTPEEILSAIQDKTPARAMAFARQYYNGAEAEIMRTA